MSLKYTANFKPGDNFPAGAANDLITNVNQNIIDIENLERKIGKKIEYKDSITCEQLNAYIKSGIVDFSVGGMYILTEGGDLITSSIGEPGNYPTKRVFKNAIVFVNAIGTNNNTKQVGLEILHKGIDLEKVTLYMGEITVSDLNTFIENTAVLTKDFKYMYKISDYGQLITLYNYASKTKTTDWFISGEMVVVNGNNVGICTVSRLENKNSIFLTENYQEMLFHRKGEMVLVQDSNYFSMYMSPIMTKNNCTITANQSGIQIQFLDNFGEVPQDKYNDKNICSDLYFSSDPSDYIKIGNTSYTSINLEQWVETSSYNSISRILSLEFFEDSDVAIALSKLTNSINVEDFQLQMNSELKCFGQYNHNSGWVVYNGYYFEPLSFVTKDTINEKISEKETKFINQQISTTMDANMIMVQLNTEIRLTGTARDDTYFAIAYPSGLKSNGQIGSVIIPCDTGKTGTIPTISLPKDVKVFGTNCSNNAFTPVSGKIYEFIFYWNGTYVCCAVNGIDV